MLHRKRNEYLNELASSTPLYHSRPYLYHLISSCHYLQRPKKNLPDGRDPKGRSKWQRRNWKPWMVRLEEWGELVEGVHWSEIHRIFVNDLKSDWSNISFKFCWIWAKRNPGFRDTGKRSALPWWCLIMLDIYWWWFWRRIFGKRAIPRAWCVLMVQKLCLTRRSCLSWPYVTHTYTHVGRCAFVFWISKNINNGLCCSSTQVTEAANIRCLRLPRIADE